MNRYLLTVIAFLASVPSIAGEPPVTKAAEPCHESITVFQDVSLIGRKDRAAHNITKRHRAMAADGWRFLGLEVYTENGDLEGFFLSYSRSVVCTGGRDAESP